MGRSMGRAGVCCGLAALLFVAAARGDDAQGSLRAKSTPQLIRLLSDESFAVRERSESELVRRGMSVRSELEAVQDSPDVEIRLRSRKILGLIAQADLASRLAAFLNDEHAITESALPGWRRLRDAVGSDRATRALYVGMAQTELELLEAYETNPRGVVSFLAGRVQLVQAATASGLNPQASPSTLAALLLIGADPNVPLVSTVGYEMFAVLSQTTTVETITQGPHSEQLKKLLAQWITRGAADNQLARNAMLIAQQYGMVDTGLNIARQIVRQPGASPNVLPYAILAIGQFGDRADVPLLEPLLANDTVCHSWHNGNFQDVIRIQIRDVALAVTIHLAGQDPANFGFELLRKDPNGLFYVYTLGFPADEQRDAAFAHWRAWSAEHSK